jgi:hypothetical protein
MKFLLRFLAWTVESAAKQFDSAKTRQRLTSSLEQLRSATIQDSTLMRSRLYQQRAALLRLRICLLEQGFDITAPTYQTATELEGESLRSELMRHLSEGLDLLLHIENKQFDGLKKVNFRTIPVSSRAYVAFYLENLLMTRAEQKRGLGTISGTVTT